MTGIGYVSVYDIDKKQQIRYKINNDVIYGVVRSGGDPMSRKAGNIPEETRAALLKAATEEFAEYGFEKSSLRRICTRAGVTTGALYASFRDKDDLFENVIKPVTDHIDSVMGEHYRRERESAGRDLLDPAGEEEDVNAVLSLLRYYYRNRQVCSVLFSHREHPAVAAFFDRLIGQIDAQGKAVAALIREGISAGAGEKSGDEEVSEFTADTIHWFSHLQVDMVFYLIGHETEEREAEMQARNMVRFMRGGFYALLHKGSLTDIVKER